MELGMQNCFINTDADNNNEIYGDAKCVNVMLVSKLTSHDQVHLIFAYF